VSVYGLSVGILMGIRINESLRKYIPSRTLGVFEFWFIVFSPQNLLLASACISLATALSFSGAGGYGLPPLILRLPPGAGRRGASAFSATVFQPFIPLSRSVTPRSHVCEQLHAVAFFSTTPPLCPSRCSRLWTFPRLQLSTPHFQFPYPNPLDLAVP